LQFATTVLQQKSETENRWNFSVLQLLARRRCTQQILTLYKQENCEEWDVVRNPCMHL